MDLFGNKNKDNKNKSLNEYTNEKFLNINETEVDSVPFVRISNIFNKCTKIECDMNYRTVSKLYLDFVFEQILVLNKSRSINKNSLKTLIFKNCLYGKQYIEDYKKGADNYGTAKYSGYEYNEQGWDIQVKETILDAYYIKKQNLIISRI
eukprot:291789_1